MRLSDFDFDLPESQIARYPAERRDGARLLILDRAGQLEHKQFPDLLGALRPNDLLITNDTKVMRARLFAQKETGGKVEILLVEPVGELWRAMVNASKSVRTGQRLVLGPHTLQVEAQEGEGFVLLRLPERMEVLTETYGALPLPPYLGRSAEPSDTERYQTIFAREENLGSVAAPTAGLHFTPDIMAALADKGVRHTTITLQVGPGTFLPVRTEDVSQHKMHAERFVVSESTAELIRKTKREGHRVVAVGTTVTRVLESLGPQLEAGAGQTEIFIRPGFEFRVVDALLTNFHLPKSTLVMLVAAFAGQERVLAAYREAIRSGYRFFSYGDAMLIV